MKHSVDGEVPRKNLHWVASAKKDLLEFPEEVIRDCGFALDFAQAGEKADSAKVMQGFGGANVQEVVKNFRTDTYRAVYTVQFEKAIYVLHCFQKKSTRGIETSQQDINLIEQRLKAAAEDYANRYPP